MGIISFNSGDSWCSLILLGNLCLALVVYGLFVVEPWC